MSTRREFMLVEAVWVLEGEGYVVLTREQADEVCDVLIGMATRLPVKYRDHGEALGWLKWRPPTWAAKLPPESGSEGGRG